LWRYSLDGVGSVVGERKFWSKLSGDHEPGGPDGIDFTPDGKLLLACNWGGGTVEAFCASNGEPIAILEMPFERPSNLHFSPDGRSVWFTEHTHMSVWRADWPIPAIAR
jgi:sugar lactone lactonase YvrE